MMRNLVWHIACYLLKMNGHLCNGIQVPKNTKRERQREIERETERDRERQREIERETERDRERQREIEAEKEDNEGEIQTIIYAERKNTTFLHLQWILSNTTHNGCHGEQMTQQRNTSFLKFLHNKRKV